MTRVVSFCNKTSLRHSNCETNNWQPQHGNMMYQ